ncbi:MAG: hypothetical protein ABI840_10675 [bacterium]
MVGDFSKKINNNNLKDIINDFEKNLLDLSNNDDSGLHYLNRYIFLKKVYEDDFIEFFKKIKSLEVGLQTVYKLSDKNGNFFTLPKLPPVNPKNKLLNEYYTWIKDVILAMTKLLQTEQEQSIVIGLNYGTWDKDVNYLLKGYDDPSIKINGLATFNLNNEMLGNKKLVRIRGIGVYMLHPEHPKQPLNSPTDNENYYKNSFVEYWNVKMKLPKQTDINGNIWEIPQLIFSAPNLNSGLKDMYIKSDTYYNADPFANHDSNILQWEIEVGKKGTIGTDRSQISHTYLILKLVSRQLDIVV